MQGDGFITRIQSWFSAGNHGRYLGIILAEIGTRHPQVIASLVCAGCGLPKAALKSVRIEPEWVFHTSSGYRRADLAIFDSTISDTDPVALIEIKYYDKPIPAQGIKPAQLADYVSWKEADEKQADERRFVLVLSRETMFHRGLSTMRWTEAARVLRPFCSRSDFVDALVKHLESEGLVMQNVDGKSLISFLKRLLCKRSGAGQLAGNIDGPAQFSKLLSNMKLLSARFNPDFRDAWTEAGGGGDEPGTKAATVDFEVCNRLGSRKEAKVFEDDKSHWVLSSAKDGGYIEVYARHALKSGTGWLRVVYGVCFYVDSDNSASTQPKATLFVRAHGGALPDKGLSSKPSSISFKKLTDLAETASDQIEAALIPKLVELFGMLLNDGHKLTATQRKALRKLEKRMTQRLEQAEAV
jgi:hypothetical protein